MGLICLPIIIFLYWLMLHCKKETPFPKWGVLCLILAGAASAIVASLLYNPLTSVATQIYGADNPKPSFLWNTLSMFITAGLGEELYKFIACRIAIIRKGMVRTWMDCVIAFATVGITFQLIENIVYGMRSGVAGAIARAICPGHFIFGVIMGYLYGKYRVSGQKKFLVLCYAVPVVLHTIMDMFLQSADLGKPYLYLAAATAIIFIAAIVVTVIKVLRWQKNKTLDVPLIGALKQEAPKSQEELPAE